MAGPLRSPVLAERFAAHMQDPEQLLVPTTVPFDLYEWVRRAVDENTALEIIALAEDRRVVPMSAQIALVAADRVLARQLDVIAIQSSVTRERLR